MNTPNLFDYATSELSQDAFLLWLLDWANPIYVDADCELHKAALVFVRKMMDMPNDWQIKSVKCYKQKYHIDVLAVINGEYALIIEDKTATKEHGKQINKYSKCLKNDPEFSKLIQRCVYYKSGNESLASIGKLEDFYKGKNLKIVMRKEVIDILSPFANIISNPIFVDYVSHINKLDEKTQSYLVEPAGKWSNEAWQGFYLALEDKLNMGDWGIDYHHKGFMMPVLPNVEDKKYDIQLYLYLDSSRNLCVKAKCKAKNVSNDVLASIVKILKANMLVHPELNGLIFDGKPSKIEKDTKDVKLIEIKRLGTKKTMFVSKSRSFSDQSSAIVPQLKILQGQLSIVVDELLEKMILQ